MSSKSAHIEEEPEEEEREGLLTGEESLKQSLDDVPRGWSRKTLVITSSLLILLLLGATLLPRSIRFSGDPNRGDDPKSQPVKANHLADNHQERSNGTHY